jgi:hypothetical protein
VVVEHHFLLEGCDWGDIDWSCYTYERWALEIAATLANA